MFAFVLTAPSRVQSAVTCPLSLYAATTSDSAHGFGQVDRGSGAFRAILSGTMQIDGMAFDSNTETLYAVTNTGGRTLYRIDPSTGVPLFIASIAGTSPIGAIMGLAFDRNTNTLYATLQASFNAQLYTIDTFSGVAVPIGSAITGNVTGLAFDAASNTLFGVDKPFVGGTKLLVINTSTGIRTAVGALGGGVTNVHGLAYCEDDARLYGIDADSEELLSIDPATGHGTPVGPTGTVWSGSYGLTCGFSPPKALNPIPFNGKGGLGAGVVLCWSSEDCAIAHDVYLGTDMEGINNADTSSSAYMGRISTTCYDPGGLNPHQTYYWRIDEFDGLKATKGDTWRFTLGGTWSTWSDTWVATDGLERRLPTFENVGPPRTDRYVGIFYFLWLGQHGTTGPYNVSQILAADPNALDFADHPAWGASKAFHHWDKPLFKYYLSDDEFVIRKHAQMLSDAGVDTLIFDVTNRFTYKNNYMKLLSVFAQIRADGGNTPQVMFLVPFRDPLTNTERLYTDLYAPGLFEELWFRWKGKPLIMADPAGLPANLLNFFTFRKPIAGYFSAPTGPNQWGWLQIHPQHVFQDDLGNAEQMTVGVAQNAWGTHAPAAFSEAISHGRDSYGRSWHNGAKDPALDAANYGYNFAEQWDRALQVDPNFVFITGWNEWVAQKLSQFNGVTYPVMFVDQVNQEYSRDIEPATGGLADHYYYQMIQYIRRYKGVNPPPKGVAYRSIEVDGVFSEWAHIPSVYRDDIGDTTHRDHPGWGNEGQYVNTTGRNDFVELKVAQDPGNIYFYARTNEPITSYTDPSWMMLFIDVDRDHTTGWEGYDFVVNRVVSAPPATVLEHSSLGWMWQHAANVQYQVAGNELEMAIPRSTLGMTGPLNFEFKWSDNMQVAGDVMEFTLSGDAAPNNRFNYLVQGTGVRGDLDNDGNVDSDDFLTFVTCYNGALRPPRPRCSGSFADIDSDGDVDIFDFLTFSNCYNGAMNPPKCP